MAELDTKWYCAKICMHSLSYKTVLPSYAYVIAYYILTINTIINNAIKKIYYVT